MACDHFMITDSIIRPRSTGELISQTKIPAHTVGIFWPGGNSLVLKSTRQKVYMIDPSQASWAGGSRMGAIDVRPDLVFCSLGAPLGLDLSTLFHMASAFPSARFVGSAESRDWMIGREGLEEMPIAPERVHALEGASQMDVRQVGVADGVKIRVYDGNGQADRVWNTVFSFAGLQVCLVRALENDEAVKRLHEGIRRRVDVLLWSLESGNLGQAADVLSALRPGYAIPIAYDRLMGGRDLARKFRDLVGCTPGVKTYLFAEDYMEGLLYSRIMSRKRRFG